LWLKEKLASPEQWSIRDRDDIVLFIEETHRELENTPEHHQPLRRGRQELLGEVEAAMETYIRSQPPAYDGIRGLLGDPPTQ
jgi:hypothetical protein